MKNMNVAHYKCINFIICLTCYKIEINYTNETRTQEKKTENKCDIKSGSVVSILKLHKAALIVKTRKKKTLNKQHTLTT